MSNAVKALLFVGAPAMEVSVMSGTEMSDLEDEGVVLISPYPGAKDEDMYVGIPVLESSVYYPYTATDNEHSNLMATIALYTREFEDKFKMPARLMISPNIS